MTHRPLQLSIRFIVFLLLIVLYAPNFAQSDSLNWKKERFINQRKKKEQMISWINQATELMGLGDIDNASKFLHKALALAEVIKDPIWMAEIRIQLGKIYYRNRKFILALHQLEIVLSLEGINHRKIYLQAIEFSGDIYGEMNEYDQAATQYRQASELMLDLHSEERWRVLFKLGNCYYNLGSYQYSLIYYQQALELANNHLTDIERYNWLVKIGSAYSNLARTHQALNNFNEALHIANGLTPPLPMTVIRVQFHIGKLYILQEDYTRAKNILETSLANYHKQDIKDLSLELGLFKQIGICLMHLEQPEEARDILLNALQLSRTINLSEEKKEILMLISQIYDQIGDKEGALAYLQQHVKMRDSILSDQQTQFQHSESKSIDLELQAQKIHEQLAELLLKEQKRKQNTLRLVSIGGFLVLSLIIYLLYSRYQIQLKANYQLEFKNLEIENQNRLLSNSNAMLEQFAYVASHDMQEPLRMIGSYTTLLKHRYKQAFDDDANDFLFFIEDAVKRMNQLLKDLLEYSRLTSRNQTLTCVSTKKIIQTVLRTMEQRILEKEAKIEVDVERFPDIIGNEVQLTQLFQNLISNALKFHQGTAIVVDIGVKKETNTYTFFVKDNGIGIHPDFQKKIFDIFQRLHTRDTYEGTGIGLATCKKIIENHGGKIWVNSTPGKGSTFYFELDAHELTAAELNFQEI